MVVYKVLKSKVEKDFSFFLVLILFNSVTIGKEIFTTQNSSETFSTLLGIISNFFYVTWERSFLLLFFETATHLVPIDIL